MGSSRRNLDAKLPALRDGDSLKKKKKIKGSNGLANTAALPEGNTL